MESEGLGAKFWLFLIGSVLAAGIAAIVLWILFGLAWAAWGGLAALIIVVLVVVGASLAYDRYQERRYGAAG